MNLLKHWRIRRREEDEESVYISEKFGVRNLHIGSDTIQSSMRIARPFDLEVAYTRCMMAFLLFREAPRRVLLVGLGGGSLAKFMYHRFPQTRIEAVEINPRVLAVARHYFCLPPDDERLSVVVGDGAEYVATMRRRVDVIMVDGYGAEEQAAEVASVAFYRDCLKALEPDGVLVVNLWGDDRKFDACLKRIESVFEGGVVCLPDGKAGNVAVFAFVRKPERLAWAELRSRAGALEARYGLGFPQFVARLAKMNPHTAERLLA